jgi:site-specific DNA recombinase
MGISLVKSQTTDASTRTEVRVAFYMRVSTAEQEVEGYSPQFQRDQLLEHVRRKEYKGWVTKPEWHFFDVGSGSEVEGRTELQRLLKCVRAGQVDIVLVWKIDRLSRNLSDLLRMFDDFSRHRVGFASTKEDLDFTGPIGRLIYQVFGALAEFERETIKMRTEEGRKASALAGNYTGTIAPYGFESVPNPGGKGRKLQAVPAEADVVRRIFHWFVYDGWVPGRIAAELNRLGISKGRANRMTEGTKWIEYTVRTMLGAEEYRGVFITNRYRLVQKKPRRHVERPREEWIIVRLPQVIDDVLFYMAQDRLRQLSRKSPGGGGKEKYLLRGKLVEAGTGRGFVGYKAGKGTKNYRRKLYERNGSRHPTISVAAKPLEAFVWEHIRRALDRPEEFMRIHRQSVEQGQEKEKLVVQLRFYEDQVSELNRKIDRVNDDFYADRIEERDRDEWVARFKDQREAAVQAKQATEADLGRLGRYTAACDHLRDFARQFQDDLDTLSEEQKQALVDLLVERVEIGDTTDGRSATVYFRFDPKEIATAMTRVEPADGFPELKSKDLVPGSVESGQSDGTRTLRGSRVTLCS